MISRCILNEIHCYSFQADRLKLFSVTLKVINKSKATAKISKAIEEIDHAILSNDKVILSISSEEQLNNFKLTFNNVLEIISSDQLPSESERSLGIARIIIDQWPYNIKLGISILDAENAFKEL